MGGIFQYGKRHTSSEPYNACVTCTKPDFEDIYQLNGYERNFLILMKSLILFHFIERLKFDA